MTDRDIETIISALTMARNMQRLSADASEGRKRVRAEHAKLRYDDLLKRIECGLVDLGE